MTATVNVWLLLALCAGAVLIGFGAGALAVWPHRYPEPEPPLHVTRLLQPLQPPPAPYGPFPADTGDLILWSEHRAMLDAVSAEADQAEREWRARYLP